MFKKKAKTFIELTDNKSVYVANEFVTGNLVVDAEEALDFKKIELKFKGFAYVHWTEQHGSGEHQRTEHYSAKEKYFKKEITVLKSDGHRKISAGRNVYPFNFQLPPNLPSSIEVRGGYVRYMVKGKIDRSGFKSDIKTMALFTVLDVLDLNHDPNSRTPSTGSDTKTMCCWCCASGPIEGKLNTDKSGYVPGEFINVNGSVENKSTSNLPGSDVSIIQRVTQHSTRKSRNFPVTVAKELGPKCKRKSSAYINNARLQIPALPPSHLRFCNIIDIDYYVQYCIDTAACHINLRVQAPIVIGSVPLQQDPNQPQPAMITTSETQFNHPSQPEMSPPAPVYNVPPPSYSAATAVHIESKETYDGTASTFAPQYNYYDWSQPAFTYN